MHKKLFHTFYIIALSIIFSACHHDNISINSAASTDTVVVVKPPVSTPSTPTTPAGGTPAPVSDTVCFNTDILPLYVSYCASGKGSHAPGETINLKELPYLIKRAALTIYRLSR
jgi:hypothetical protein